MASVPFQDWIDSCAKGPMRTNLDRTFKLEEVGQAHEYMEANKVRFLPELYHHRNSSVIFMLFAGVSCFRLLIGLGVWKSRDPSRLDSGPVRA
jgi:hypothetical protein